MSIIRIGNQTSFAAARPTDPFEYAVRNGFRAFEWFPDRQPSGQGWQESDLDIAARSEIRQLAQKHDIEMSVHAPWDIDPLQPQAADRLVAIQTFARDLGAKLVNIHLTSEHSIDAYVDAIAPFAAHLNKTDVALAIENTPLHTPAQFNELFATLRKVRSLRRVKLGMCIDTGHANLCAQTRNDYLAFIDQLDRKIPIIHVHAHENHGDKDSHLPLFTGPAGLDDNGLRGFVHRLKARDYSGSIILEQWPDPPSLLLAAHDRLTEMFRGNGEETETE